LPDERKKYWFMFLRYWFPRIAFFLNVVTITCEIFTLFNTSKNRPLSSESMGFNWYFLTEDNG